MLYGHFNILYSLSNVQAQFVAKSKDAISILGILIRSGKKYQLTLQLLLFFTHIVMESMRPPKNEDIKSMLTKHKG